METADHTTGSRLHVSRQDLVFDGHKAKVLHASGLKHPEL